MTLEFYAALKIIGPLSKYSHRLMIVFLFCFCSFCTEVQKVIHKRDTKSHARHIPFSVPAHTQRLTKDSHNTRNFMPCSIRIVCGFFDVPQCSYMNIGICETGPTVYRPYTRRIESLTICWFNYKGNSLPTLGAGPAEVELTTSRMTARCSTTEPPVRCWCFNTSNYIYLFVILPMTYLWPER